jgi:protein-tyrosine phosphatase
MAEIVLRERLAHAGLAERVRVGSSGTGTWHLGEGIDRSAGRALRAAGYDPSPHRAQRFGPSWFSDFDVIMTMDSANHVQVRSQARTPEERGRIVMFRAFDPAADHTADPPDVPDPFGGPPSAFDDVLAIVERTADVIVEELRTALAEDGLGSDRRSEG